jgi:hypothetical protein
MIQEHDRIVLTAPVTAEGLEVGDVGTVVHVYAHGKAYEVEFTTLRSRGRFQCFEATLYHSERRTCRRSLAAVQLVCGGRRCPLDRRFRSI